MRDKTRIGRITRMLQVVWIMPYNQDMRLGQLLQNIAGENDLWNIEDDKWEELIEQWMMRSTTYV